MATKTSGIGTWLQSFQTRRDAWLTAGKTLVEVPDLPPLGTDAEVSDWLAFRTQLGLPGWRASEDEVTEAASKHMGSLHCPRKDHLATILEQGERALTAAARRGCPLLVNPYHDLQGVRKLYLGTQRPVGWCGYAPRALPPGHPLHSFPREALFEPVGSGGIFLLGLLADNLNPAGFYATSTVEKLTREWAARQAAQRAEDLERSQRDGKDRAARAQANPTLTQQVQELREQVAKLTGQPVPKPSRGEIAAATDEVILDNSTYYARRARELAELDRLRERELALYGAKPGTAEHEELVEVVKALQEAGIETYA